ncbi:uncharacterized protein LOC132725273 [Ruditapes philippinarum]|uniref:uncharacterized protein LOC132725273 n=1 Tax=Ruditapes philippinarum TaxID=129788 RepID=UPI00295ABF6C|nr:uncharacterized protein LOC132725273 [Ruditapes philippinarum]
MEENPSNDTKYSAKSTFKDILINANNDDVIIPTSATFDKVVLHIGIGSRSGVTIEKPPVKHGKALISSVEFATRKFKKSFYKGDNKGLDVTGKERGDFRKPVVESDEKFRKDMQNETDVERIMSQLASSFYSEAPLETKKAKEVLSETGLTEQVYLENTKKDNTRANIRDEVAMLKTCPPYQIEKYILIARDNENCFAEIGHNDREYVSEVVMLPNKEKIDSPLYNNYDLVIKELKERNDGLRNKKDDARDLYTEYLERVNTKTEVKTVDMVNVKPEIIEKFAMPTVVQEKNDSLRLESPKTKCDITSCDYISYQEERAPDDESDASDPTENTDDELTDTDTLETVVHKKPPDPLSDSETSITVIHFEPDQIKSDRDTSNDTQDTSIASDSDGASTEYTTTDDELYDSDTLDDVSDIEFDDDIADIKGLDNDIVDTKELDDDILDIEAIDLQDQGEVDITATWNDISDTPTNDNDLYDDDDNLFGILNVYIESELHFDHSKIPVAEHCEQKIDFGYKYFSFSTFFN